MMPEGWRECALGVLLEKIEGGGTLSRENPTFWGGNIPWASVKDISSGITSSTQESITTDGLTSSASRIVPAGTIVIATRMAVGKAVRFSVDVAINQDLKAIHPGKHLDVGFLFRVFQLY
jgi:type I restriction enzyme S subunit